MSAFIVSKTHVATLAVWALGGSHRISGARFGGLVMLANELAAENAKSVGYRYRETNEPYVFANEDEVFKFAKMGFQEKPVAILKAIACLKYQSCEHPTWEESNACLALRHMQSAAIQELPGYEEAQWEIPEAVSGVRRIA